MDGLLCRPVRLLTQTSQTKYEELCKLDVLGLRDPRDHSQAVVLEEFKERLTRSPKGWYETPLPWKANHPLLPSNKDGSLKSFHNLNRKLQREGVTEEYDAIIKVHHSLTVKGILHSPQERGS